MHSESSYSLSDSEHGVGRVGCFAEDEMGGVDCLSDTRDGGDRDDFYYDSTVFTAASGRGSFLSFANFYRII